MGGRSFSILRRIDGCGQSTILARPISNQISSQKVCSSSFDLTTFDGSSLDALSLAGELLLICIQLLSITNLPLIKIMSPGNSNSLLILNLDEVFLLI
jgi:hypothetical protein